MSSEFTALSSWIAQNGIAEESRGSFLCPVAVDAEKRAKIKIAGRLAIYRPYHALRSGA